MKILVLNGSPKGKNSVTLQTVNYLQLLYPAHSFEVLHVGAQIKALETNFTSAKQALQTADLLLFAYPVYTFIAPYQMHRFIELVKAADIDLAGKYASQVTTSKHFYDVTAHRYIQDNCQDLGVKFVRGLSADMDDLQAESGRKQARDFFEFLCWSVENDRYEPLPAQLPPADSKPTTVPAAAAGQKPGDVVVVTDCGPEDTALQGMIDRFRAVLPRATRVVNLREYPFKGGCLGCFHCASDGACVYTDGFDHMLREEIQTAESIIYAFTIKDHSMGARFKLYDDRQFCNGHRTVTMGMPMGYLINGAYSREFNLQMIVEGRAQVGGNFLAGVATNETDPDTAIDQLAHTLCYALEHRYAPPSNFYGVGGMKIFRDLIWLMQGMMKADHRFYKAHGQYDFPQKKWPTMLAMYLVGAMQASPTLRDKMGGKMTEGMLMPYTQVLEKVKAEQKKQQK